MLVQFADNADALDDMINPIIEAYSREASVCV
jgi:hypothetical protein